jgi:hypothetical protein
MSTEFIVMEASAQVPSSWKHRGGPRGYRKLALVEVEKGVVPKMISERARGVVRIVQVWDRLYEGKTERSAYHRALNEVLEWAMALNRGKVTCCLEVPSAESFPESER